MCRPPLKLLVVVGLLAVPRMVAAQSAIAGVVRDTTGAVLPGVTVEVTSPALIEKVRTATTDQAGQYRVVDLRPGSYSVAFTLAGFNSIRREGIVLEANFTAPVNAELRVGAIAETVTRFADARAKSCLLTKVDEAASLGGVLSVLTRAELPISYVSEGQRVPEDLRPARALELVSSAVQLAKTSGAAADEDLLRRRYGDVAHALA